MILAINVAAFLLCMAAWSLALFYALTAWRSNHPYAAPVAVVALVLAVVFGAVFLIVD